MLGLILVALVVAELRRPLNSDSAWLLYLAGRVLLGDRLYVDLIEINPPLVIWLQIPLVFLAGRLGLEPSIAFKAGVLLWVLGCLLLSARLFRSVIPAEGQRRWILLVASLVLLGWTRAHFGEREHLALAALLPYFVVSAAAVEGQPLRPGVRLMAGLLAAVGFTIKPHFMLVWLACLGYVVWRRRTARWFLSAENLAILAFGVLYGLTLLVTTPEYLPLVHRLAPTYQALARKSLDSLLVDNLEALCAVGAILAYAILRGSSQYRGLTDILAVATAGFLLTVILQGKGFSYHYYPVSGGTLLLAAAGLAGRAGLRGTAPQKVASLTLGALLTLGVGSGVAWSLVQLTQEDPVYAEQRRMAGYIRRQAADGSVLRLGYEDNFPLITQAGATWAMRFPNLWFVHAAYATEIATSSAIQYRSPSHMGAVERWCFDLVVDDFVRNRPSLLMVMRPHLTNAGEIVTPVDYLGYFSQDNRFRAALDAYDYRGHTGGYSVFVRRDPRRRVGS